jgi:hypothetical protein
VRLLLHKHGVTDVFIGPLKSLLTLLDEIDEEQARKR